MTSFCEQNFIYISIYIFFTVTLPIVFSTFSLSLSLSRRLDDRDNNAIEETHCVKRSDKRRKTPHLSSTPCITPVPCTRTTCALALILIERTRMQTDERNRVRRLWLGEDDVSPSPRMQNPEMSSSPKCVGHLRHEGAPNEENARASGFAVRNRPVTETIYETVAGERESHMPRCYINNTWRANSDQSTCGGRTPTLPWRHDNATYLQRLKACHFLLFPFLSLYIFFSFFFFVSRFHTCPQTFLSRVLARATLFVATTGPTTSSGGSDRCSSARMSHDNLGYTSSTVSEERLWIRHTEMCRILDIYMYIYLLISKTEKHECVYRHRRKISQFSNVWWFSDNSFRAHTWRSNFNRELICESFSVLVFYHVGWQDVDFLRWIISEEKHSSFSVSREIACCSRK